MEFQLDAIKSGKRHNQEQVDDHLETLEMGCRQAQKEINRSQSKYAANLDLAFSELWEEIVGFRQQISQQLNALSMLARQPNVHLPMEFTPRASSPPILPTPMNRQRSHDSREAEDKVEAEEDNWDQGVGSNHSTIPKSQMDIPYLKEKDLSGGSDGVNGCSTNTE